MRIERGSANEIEQPTRRPAQVVLSADARYPTTAANSKTCNKLLSPLAIALACEALERANAGLDAVGSTDGGATIVCFELASASVETIRRRVSSSPP